MIKINTMQYKGYHALIQYDSSDDCFVGTVLGIKDSLNFQGRTVDELKKAFHESIDNYLDLCKKIGKDPEKEYSGTFNIRISPKLHQKAALLAEAENVSLNQIIARAVDKYLSDE